LSIKKAKPRSPAGHRRPPSCSRPSTSCKRRWPSSTHAAKQCST
jgi:hypothetical protein